MCFSNRGVRELFGRENYFSIGHVEFIGLIGHSSKFGLKLRRVFRNYDTDLGVTHTVMKFEPKLAGTVSKEQRIKERRGPNTTLNMWKVDVGVRRTQGVGYYR